MAIAALLAATVLDASSATAAFTTPAIADTSALVMGGTGHSLATPPDTLSYVEAFVAAAQNNYVSPSSSASPLTGVSAGPYNAVAVITPEEDAPQYGGLSLDESVAIGQTVLHGCITSTVCDYNPAIGSASPSPEQTMVVFGYSQSAVIAMLEKARLASHYATGQGPEVSFVVIGDSKRPNGGLYARDPKGILIPAIFGGGSTFDGAAVTNTQYATVDVAIQYDGLADFPVNPLNLLADANAYMGMMSVHQSYGERSLSEPGVINQGKYGDTTYFLLPTQILPLLQPLQRIPFFGHLMADMLDAPLRVLVEASYDRTTSPGVPTSFNLLYFPHPVKTALAFAIAIPVGLDNAVEDLAGIRPLGTHRPGPYGVGGAAPDCGGSTVTAQVASSLAAASLTVRDITVPAPARRSAAMPGTRSARAQVMAEPSAVQPVRARSPRAAWSSRVERRSARASFADSAGHPARN